jgi:hypothetical protein
MFPILKGNKIIFHLNIGGHIFTGSKINEEDSFKFILIQVPSQQKEI